MRLFLAHNAYQHPGGEDAVFEAEAALLKERGHAVVQYLEENDHAAGMHPLALATNAVWSKTAHRKISAILQELRPSVAHFHNTFLLISPSAYYACHAAGVPVIQTLHNYRLLCPAAIFYREGRVCEECIGQIVPWRGAVHACYRDDRAASSVVATMIAVHNLLRTWSRMVDVYIALSEFGRQKFIEGGLPAEKIVVKPNFLNADPGAREGSGRHALFVGRLAPEKGVSTLLRAWQNVPEVPLKIVGSGPLMAEISTFADKQGLDQVEVLGHRSRAEVLSLMKEARFLIFPSDWYECFPVTIAESFACGVPVIASRLGAMAEIIEDGRTGLTFSPGDADDLCAKVEWAYTHPKELAQMGRRAREEFEAKYTPARNYELLLNIYRLAIEKAKERN